LRISIRHPAAKNCRLRRPWCPSQSRSMNDMAITSPPRSEQRDQQAPRTGCQQSRCPDRNVMFHSFPAALPQDLSDYSALQHRATKGRTSVGKPWRPAFPQPPTKGKKGSGHETQFHFTSASEKMLLLVESAPQRAQACGTQEPSARVRTGPQPMP
jgi:hypothetical protein